MSKDQHITLRLLIACATILLVTIILCSTYHEVNKINKVGYVGSRYETFHVEPK